MVLKIGVVLCAVMIVSGNELTRYGDGVFLRVVNGNFTIELASNKFRPESIYAADLGITQVDRGFARIPSLKRLSMEDNLITSIGASVFEGLPQLEYLNLARNTISSLVVDTFEGLTKLKVLHLNGNRLAPTITFSFSDATLPSLTELYLQRNLLANLDLRFVGMNRFVCNSTVRRLDLSNNRFASVNLLVDSSTGPYCLQRLTHLNLDSNILTTFNPGHVNLESLSLNRNLLTGIPSINPGLKFLSMSNNRVSSLRYLENTENIIRLILSNNLINYNGSPANISFQNLPFLEHLALDGNRIVLLPDGFFYNLPSLRSLYLANNTINTVRSKAFEKVPALRELSFRNNQLQLFPGEESFGKSNLNYLDLTNNRVTNIGGVNANRIPQLRVLNLSGNPLTRLDPDAVYGSNFTILF